jgi:3-deoxy-D-manno-octulosonate 8-phosphate phosphatase (KDO 8-P phosphatase)
VPRDPATVAEKAARVQLLLFDVDGVLTDGKITVHPDGSESKVFDIRDGTGIVLAHMAGLRTGLLSGRASASTSHRAAQLGIHLVRQNLAAKLRTYLEVLREERLTDAEVAFMGDDLLDLPVLARAGLGAAPADAVAEVRSQVDWVSEARGGQGAARELVELVLRAQRRWEGIIERYLREVPR